MLEEFQFRNLDSGQKSFSEDYLKQVFRNMKVKSDIYFEKTSRGLYRGQVHSQSKWGSCYAKAEAKTLVALCHLLEKKIKAKAFRQKVRQHSLSSEMPFNLPDHLIKESEPFANILERERIYGELSPRKVLRTLIVEDDIEALLPVDRAFQKFGIETVLSKGGKETVAQIRSGAFDIIVLDWQLGRVTGAEILNRCSKEISRSRGLVEMFKAAPPKIVTYSGQNLAKINFSKNTKPYFSYVDHWSKPIKYGEIEMRAGNIINEIYT